ncbi:MAG: BamA/TamA family outer membrane protein [Candidatus Neomarinimicrobiota bacterium]
MLILTAVLAGADPPVITGIAVIGNDITRNYIIEREVNHPRPAPYDSLQAHRDRNHIYNMGIFESVQVYPRRTGPGEAELVVEVVETIRMVPIPIFYYLDDVGWSYGGGVSFLNFRGLNQRLLLSATTGGEKTYGLVFYDPWLLGHRISAQGQAVRIYRGHPVYDYRTMVETFEAGVGWSSPQKTFGVSGSIGLRRREVVWREGTDLPLPEDEFTDLRHEVLRAELDVMWRTTDIWRDPTRGFSLRLYISPVTGITADSPDYVLVYTSAAVFKRLIPGSRPLVLGLGMALNRYDHQVPYYKRQFLGRTWVRGYHIDPEDNPQQVHDRLEGNSVAMAGLELRQTIFPRRLVWDLEMGLGGVLFLDAGWAFGPEAPLRNAVPAVGFGLGIRIYLPLIEVFALDMGYNRHNSRPNYRLGLAHKF